MSARGHFVLIAVVVAIASPLRGQGPAPARHPAAGDPIDGRLAPTPLEAEALGLRIHPPAGAVTTTQISNENVSFLLTGPGDSWNMRVMSLTPAVALPTAATLVTEHLTAIEASGREFSILVNEPRTYGGVVGHLLYLQLAPTIEGAQPLVSGWLILPTSTSSFLVVTIATTADHFTRLRGTLAASFQTIELRSLEDVNRLRLSRREKGRSFVNTLTPAKLRTVVGEHHWYRVFKPAPSGRRADDTEVGFVSIQCLEAMRGELTPERSPKSFGSMETEKGLMVLLEARTVVDAEKQHYLDVEGRYWLDWDRDTETWSVRQTQRIGPIVRTSAETGVRNRTTLDVIKSSRERLTRDPHRWLVPDDVYLSQCEVFLLGRLLPKDGSITGEMSFYYYDPGSQQVAERIDRWERVEDGSGWWTLTTQPLLWAAATTQTYDGAGGRIERIGSDGTVTRRIELAELQRLWRSKGLLPR